MRRNDTTKMILTALMMAFVTVIILILPIPVPAVNGYINLGDGMIFIAIILLGWKYGAAAGGLGAALADLLIGYGIWAPFTFLIKGGMALIIGLILNRSKRQTQGIYFLSMLCAGIWMTLGYFLVGGLLYGNFLAAAISIPLDLLQFMIGAVLAVLILNALNKTPFRSYFTYHFPVKK